MKKTRSYILYLLAFLVITLGACSHEEAAHADGEAITYTCPMHPQIVQNEPGTCPICGMDLVPVSQSGKNEGELMLSDSQIALGNIAVKRVKYGDVGSSTILTGQLVLDETQTDVVSSRAAGRIERLYIKETGQSIRKGQPLYELYSEEILTLQREYLLALKQNQELGKENPRFASFLEAAKKKLLLYGQTEAQVRNLASTQQLDARVTFVAPSSGVITEVAAAEGQYVAEGSVLYRLGKLGGIWVEAELYPQEVAQVQVGDPVQVSVQGFSQDPVSAKVTFLSPELRAGSQVAVLRAELPNAEGRFLPGMQANVTLSGKTDSILTVPTDAVIRDKSGSHVWVQTGKGTFQARMVTLGEEGFNNVAILTGIRENDKVVTSGAYLLYSEFVLKKGGDPMAGHNH
ncbi:efflux RND transporter periplasmic adaptor subunit [Pontibacter qinzhouensis]|uniref:Efflux RND transporter periplasmic adaptor subunit n=1 Tax=Pontibacter qinzhouensis TaxID=2603253 RepID=A0A5C8K9P9_9BACT|nr:efflux RND transporter periplasmic adaptor subunit [Pontibacter qinzhouensis]TXK45870.1 efflux RND transporter periplasmic adaptor subunit [Pontibacter qinzhouensis]